jgi:hypothetical protein
VTFERIFIGFDPREAVAYDVCEASIDARLSRSIMVKPIILDEMRERGIYRRPTETRDGKLWDVISEAPMSTEFAISRFLVPHLMNYRGWAVFMDCDMLVRTDMAKLFDLADDSYAVMCVKHHYEPPEGVKMDGQTQLRYARKNWSSVMLSNCEHPSNRALNVGLINALPGRDLHRFCWLEDNEIGELDASWNWLVGHSSRDIDPDIVHFTEGGPWFDGFDDVPFVGEWRRELVKLRSKAA